MLRIGKLELASPVILAPMCGVCDRPYLRLLRRYTKDCLLFHEMFSAQGLMTWAKDRPIPVDLAGKPLGLQIFGHVPDTMGLAARKLADAGADVVDLNLGCPVPKIAKNCDGSALLKETRLLAEILRAMVAACPDIPVTIKMRLGWDDDYRNYLEVAKIAEDAGIAAVTVHGRTRSQMYSGSADWEAIGEVAQTLSIPVIGNGDVSTPQQARHLMETYGVAGVMVGRAAMGNPWLLPRMVHYLKTGELLPEPTPAERVEVALAHCELLATEKGERVGVPECRKHVAWYTKGLPGSAECRQRVNETRTLEALRAVLLGYLDSLYVTEVA